MNGLWWHWGRLPFSLAQNALISKEDPKETKFLDQPKIRLLRPTKVAITNWMYSLQDLLIYNGPKNNSNPLQIHLNRHPKFPEGINALGQTCDPINPLIATTDAQTTGYTTTWISKSGKISSETSIYPRISPHSNSTQSELFAIHALLEATKRKTKHQETKPTSLLIFSDNEEAAKIAANQYTKNIQFLPPLNKILHQLKYWKACDIPVTIRWSSRENPIIQLSDFPNKITSFQPLQLHLNASKLIKKFLHSTLPTFTTFARVFPNRIDELNLFHYVSTFPSTPESTCPLLVSPTHTQGAINFLLYILRHNQTCLILIPNFQHSPTLQILTSFSSFHPHDNLGSQFLFGSKCTLSNSWSLFCFKKTIPKNILPPHLFV